MKNTSVLLLVVALAGCAGTMQGKSPQAQATLQPTTGNETAGTVTFTQNGDKVLVEATLTGLKPGDHGVHIHEKGDCSAPDGMSAGGHFNPSGSAHGSPEGVHHAGDMGNAVAGADGKASLRIELSGVTVDPGANSVVGRAVIVHAAADDFVTQPTGNAGKRVACGVIAAKP